MPPKGYSVKKRIEELTKELAAAKASDEISRTANIHLKMKIDELNAGMAALKEELARVRAPVQENTDLKEALAALQVELNNERDIKFGLIEAIRERERKNSVLQGQFDHMVKITEEINIQREALRAALKAVL